MDKNSLLEDFEENFLVPLGVLATIALLTFVVMTLGVALASILARVL